MRLFDVTRSDPNDSVRKPRSPDGLLALPDIPVPKGPGNLGKSPFLVLRNPPNGPDVVSRFPSFLRHVARNPSGNIGRPRTPMDGAVRCEPVDIDAVISVRLAPQDPSTLGTEDASLVVRGQTRAACAICQLDEQLGHGIVEPPLRRLRIVPRRAPLRRQGGSIRQVIKRAHGYPLNTWEQNGRACRQVYIERVAHELRTSALTRSVADVSQLDALVRLQRPACGATRLLQSEERGQADGGIAQELQPADPIDRNS